MQLGATWKNQEDHFFLTLQRLYRAHSLTGENVETGAVDLRMSSVAMFWQRLRFNLSPEDRCCAQTRRRWPRLHRLCGDRGFGAEDILLSHPADIAGDGREFFRREAKLRTAASRSALQPWPDLSALRPCSRRGAFPQLLR